VPPCFAGLAIARGKRKEVRRMTYYRFPNNNKNPSPAEILQEAHKRIY
jgi:hypothetical protein